MLDGLPTPQGVTRNDNQPFPIFGWLEVSHGEPVNGSHTVMTLRVIVPR